MASGQLMYCREGNPLSEVKMEKFINQQGAGAGNVAVWIMRKQGKSKVEVLA